jgi:Na+/H+ antiporter NhaD/arsenite permease-like protein
MKIDRPGAAIIGGVLMVAVGVVGTDEALQSIDFATIVLLFSMMVVVANLRLGGFFERIAEWVVERLHPNHLLPIPFVVAVATSSNIGSVGTITGNPQNMLIGSLSGISYLDFIARLGPVALAGLFVNWGLIYWLCLRGRGDRAPVAQALAAPEFQHAAMRKKPVVLLLVVLAGFLAGVPPAMAAAVGAALLLITRTVEPRRVYDGIDWGLLVFFVGLFIIVAGGHRAGLTARLLEPVAAWGLHRMAIFVLVSAMLSNVVSNVPAVMLLRTVVPSFPDPHMGWLVLAMASTLAGNLTITGSVANIIVLERAAAEDVTIGFREFFRIGLPVTIATLLLGSVWLWMSSP